jgi:hypothetical protein
MAFICPVSNAASRFSAASAQISSIAGIGMVEACQERFDNYSPVDGRQGEGTFQDLLRVSQHGPIRFGHRVDIVWIVLHSGAIGNACSAFHQGFVHVRAGDGPIAA